MSSPSAERRPEAPPRDFIREIVAQDLVSGKHGSAIVTRFPPEPNGRLHIGHAKAICIDFGVAQEFGGRCNLRFDDTNPVKESQEYVDEIERDIRWLGLRLGRAPLSRVRLFRAALSVGRAAHPRGEGVRRQPDGRPDARVSRHAHRARPRQPVSHALGRREPRSVPPHARGRVRGRRARAARQDRHGVGQHQHARSGDVPDSQDAASTHRRQVGASIRCTTGRTASRTTSRGSRTRSARSSTKTTGRSTTGIWTRSGCARRARARSSSRA